MLIVATKHAAAINTANGVNTWGAVNVIPAANNQAAATNSITAWLAGLGANDPLCFLAHGNDMEMGGTGTGNDTWGWDRATLAGMVNTIPATWISRRILFQICCTAVANYSAGVAVALGALNRRNICCYGYNRAVSVTAGVPGPGQLDTNVSLQVSIS